MKKDSFLFFHFNLFFSSIDETSRKLIIKNCYYPILNIAEIYNIPVNIEASARTLLEIKKIDKEFIKLLNKLIKIKKVHFVGSGFNQIIAPLVPFEVTSKNLKIGNYYYKKILGKKPETALVNEMAFSADIAEIYTDSGYKNIIIDYDNLVSSKKNKTPDHCYTSLSKKKLNLIYASSFLFQQFQSCVYGDISINKYLNNINKYKKNININLPIYSGDAEVFNFRTGRFYAEREKIHNEWKRVYKLLDSIINKNDINLCLINDFTIANSQSKIYQDTAEAPISVKKQPKYNVSRWAVSGRSDQKINTACYKILKQKRTIIKKIGFKKFYENLLDLWSSDYRTHITKKRWIGYNQKLNYMLAFVKKDTNYKDKHSFKKIIPKPSVYFDEEKTLLFINTSKIKMILNVRRGLSIDSLAYKSQKFKPIIGTIHRDETRSIYEGADFYTGHTIHEIINPMLKITDLNNTVPRIYENEKCIKIFSNQKFKYGKLVKTIELRKDTETVFIQTNYAFNKKNIGSIRMNNITFLNINKKKIRYLCNNGGKKANEHALNNYFDQSSAPTKFVSIKNGLGCTDSRLGFKIGNDVINFEWDNSENFVLPSIQYKKINEQKILRIFFCNQEFDETSHPIKSSLNFKVKISTNKK